MDLENIDQLSEDKNFDIEEYGGKFSAEELADKKKEIQNNSLENENKKRNIKMEKVKKHFVISEVNLILARRLIRDIKENSEKLSQIFSDSSGDIIDTSGVENVNLADAKMANLVNEQDDVIVDLEHEAGDDINNNIVKGFFNGTEMIGSDGRQYSVPYNYASKSKLVEGDTLKLTITPRGGFVYKQIKPIERIRVIATLDQDENDDFVVYSGKRKWNVLTASVSFFRGQVGDEVVVLIPKSAESKWAAIENIIKK